MFLKCMPPTTPQPLFAHFSETIILLLYQLFSECSVPQTKNSMIVPASGASELPITHIWYSIHTSPCCTSFSSLSQVPFVSHEVPPAGQFVSVGSLSLGLAFHENNCQYANMKHSEPLWTHSVTPLVLHNSTTSMSTPRRQWEETYAKTFVKNTAILKES